jgi:REase_DpnII-MboI
LSVGCNVMRNITLIKLRLKKAIRNLQDYLRISYLTGAIDGDDTRYSSIWDDYIIAKKSLEEIDNHFFSALDIIDLPKLIEATSLPDRTKYMGYPAQSRNIIKAAIENALEYINAYETTTVIKGEAINETAESVELIIRLFNNWAKMISSFETHRKNITKIKVTNEYEMQYLLEGILRLFFDDVRPETYTTNYANHSNRTDFILPKQKILIETKMTRDGLDNRRLSDELIIDKEHYRKQPGIDIILCLVYDPEKRIKNPEGLKDIQELVTQPYFNIFFSY